MSVIALQLDDHDSVASVLADVASGDPVNIQQPDGSIREIIALHRIPFGHKIAIREVAAGAIVLKYGAPIGRAKQALEVGEYVHVHNVRGLIGGRTGAEETRQASAAQGRVADVARLRAWLERLALAAGVSATAAADLADSIVDAEQCGVRTHGLRRLPSYFGRIASGAVNGKAVPQVTRSAEALVEVDGQNGIGAHVLRVAADEAARRARSAGACIALVRNSSHAGAIGWVADHLARQGLVALVVSNGTPLIAPPEGTQAFVSNSPISIGAPMPDGDTFLLDMATGAVSRDRIRQAAESGVAIPYGWALDAAGQPTRDAAAALAGTLLPIGGAARGFSLVLGLEVLAALLPGALSDVLVPPKEAGDAPEQIGHFILAIDPAHTTSGDTFTTRIADMEKRMRSLPRPVAAAEPRMPGRRRGQLRKASLDSGIRVPATLCRQLAELGDAWHCPLTDVFKEVQP